MSEVHALAHEVLLYACTCLDAGHTNAMVAKGEDMHVGDEKRWRLTDVVGEEDGLGIECLSGSGAIAR